MEFEPIPIEFDDQVNGPYGISDEWIRDWIEDSKENSDAFFPMELWNMCDRLPVLIIEM